MTGIRARCDALETVSVMRLGLLALAVGAVVVTAAELAFLEHWDGTLQLLPWAALLTAAVSIVLIAVRPSQARVWVARILAGICLLLGGIGVAVHVISNYDSGILDFRYTATWPTMPDLDRWWLAATDGVAPSPPLAAGSLSFAALLVLLASVRAATPPSATIDARPRSSVG